MTIELTTPLTYDPGHGGAPEVLNEVKVIDFHVNIVEFWLTMTTQYGNTVDGAWIAGNAPGHDVHIQNTPVQVHPDDPEQSIPADNAYNIMIMTKVLAATISALALEDPVPDLYVYNLVSDGLYQYLLDNGHYIGTINE